MRYQLRYIRTPRARSSPGAKHDDSPPKRDRTNSSVTMGAPRIDRWQRVLPRRRLVLTFDVVRHGIRSRSSVEERPPHTREVAGSNPAGTTTNAPSSLHHHVSDDIDLVSEAVDAGMYIAAPSAVTVIRNCRSVRLAKLVAWMIGS